MSERKKIAFLREFEVCNVKGDALEVDLFIGYEGTGVTFTMFRPGEPNEVRDEFSSHEQQAWLEAAKSKMVEVLDPEPDSIEDVLRDVLRGFHGDVPVPNLPLMGNDETVMSERDDLEAEFFFGVLSTALLDRN